MTKKCIYCSIQIDETSVVDVCRKCGLSVWGENMFNAIVKNMEDARDAGDLYQGSVTDSPSPNQKSPEPQKTISFVEEAKKTLAQQSEEQNPSQKEPTISNSQIDEFRKTETAQSSTEKSESSDNFASEILKDPHLL